MVDSRRAFKKVVESVETPSSRSGNEYSGPSKGNVTTLSSEMVSGHGKAILLGEHSVVYGRHAIAAPVPIAVQARISKARKDVTINIPRWQVHHRLQRDPVLRRSFEKPVGIILDQLGLTNQSMKIEVFPKMQRAIGLGGSAAMAVAIIRAIDQYFALSLTEHQINSLAFEAEKASHGNPSGIDNTVATFGRFLLYRRGEPPLIQELTTQQPINMVIGLTGVASLTVEMVAKVKMGWEREPQRYEQVFDEIDALALQGVNAINNNDIETLGELMNRCQEQLSGLQVSCKEIDQIIRIARNQGALGAKLTGGGGGGSIIALCAENSENVAKAIQNAGYQAVEVQIG